MNNNNSSLYEFINQVLITIVLLLSMIILFIVCLPQEEPEQTEMYVSKYPESTQEAIKQSNEEAYRNYISTLSAELDNLSVDEIEGDDDEIGADLIGFLIEITADDIDLMARVVMSEASVLNFEAKQMIAQTIVNRVRSKKFPNTVTDVVKKKNQYSTQDNGKPNADCYAAVYQALRYADYPTNMYYFRMGHFHDWATDFTCVDGCYFSTDGEELK